MSVVEFILMLNVNIVKMVGLPREFSYFMNPVRQTIKFDKKLIDKECL